MKLNTFRWKPVIAPQQISAPTLLFLHGLGGTGQIWRPISAALESEYDCLAPDQRGHGASRPLPEGEKNNLHALDFAKDIKELLNDNKIEKCFLIGHSMGVRTALALTTLIPEKITGLIALDLGLSSQWGGGMGIALSQFIQKLPESFSNREELKKYLNQNCPDPSIAQYLYAVSKKIPEDELWGFPFDHEALVKTIEQAHQAPLQDWLLEAQKNKIPFLFLHGRTSKVWSIADYEAQKKLYENPLTQFESWENTGHGLPFEQKNKFIERLKEFIVAINRKHPDPAKI